MPSILLLLLAATLLLLTSGGLTIAQDHPGWPTAALIAKIEALVGTADAEQREYDSLPKFFDAADDPDCYLREGERVRSFALGDFSSVIMVGDDEVTHSLWFYFPIVNLVDSRPAFDFYAAIFEYLIPGWDGAATWAGVSLNKSWDAAGRAFTDPMISYEETVARHAEGGIRLATSGVPPDLVYYRVTSRPECEIITPFMLEKPRRVPHDQSRYDAVQRSGQLTLNDIYPRPVDVSATPIYLGTTYGHGRFGEPAAAFRFDKLPDVAISFEEWIDRQVSDTRFASTTAAIADDWGYTTHFLHLITDAALPIAAEQGPHALIIEKFSTGVRKPAEGGFAFEPYSSEAALFATSMPEDDGRAAETSAFSAIGVDYLRLESAEAPVDVSATPMMLGRLHLYSGGYTGDRPGFYEPSVNGMTLTVTDRATGEAVAIDIGAWAEAEGAMKGEPGSRLMAEPSLFFELGGKAHRLILGILTLDRGAKKIDYVTGHVFRVR